MVLTVAVAAATKLWPSVIAKQRAGRAFRFDEKPSSSGATLPARAFFSARLIKIVKPYFRFEMSKLSDAAFCVGDRSASSARELWQCIPQVYRDHATFHKDDRRRLDHYQLNLCERPGCVFACDWAKRRRDGRVKTGLQLGFEASFHYNLSCHITFWESSSQSSPPRLSSIGACGGRTPEVSTNTLLKV